MIASVMFLLVAQARGTSQMRGPTKSPSQIYSDIAALTRNRGEAGDPLPRSQRKGTRRERYRAIFLSDMHLGARMCRPGAILDFLDRNTADTVYLVGDIVDNWDPLSPNWTIDHHRVLRRLLDFPDAGTRVIYIPGNHDSFFRQLAGLKFGGIDIRRETTHVAADGRRYLVVHGDCCDIFARKAPFMNRLGSVIEGIARGIDTLQRRAARAVGRGEWPGIENAILWTNAMIRKYDRFEERLLALATTAGTDGVICGHFHEPALHSDLGPVYANCGDWSSNCTAIVEDHDGRLCLLSANETAAENVFEEDLSAAPAEIKQLLAS
jgi:UDP-2,3-diacylglucosamine pyrophosphatase LpxH